LQELRLWGTAVGFPLLAVAWLLAAMNYNHDTDQDLDWAADQMRREKNLGSGLPDMGIRRTTTSLPLCQTANVTLTSPREGGLVATAGVGNTTVGHALSALAINTASPQQCQQICDSLVPLLADRDRIAVHAEFVELKGIEALLGVVRQHGRDACLSALRVLDKLSRTSAREMAAASAIEIIVRCCEKDGQAPRILDGALRVLHGLTFEAEVKELLIRRGVRELAELLVEGRPEDQELKGSSDDPDEEEATMQAWSDVVSISNRLLQRLGGVGNSARLPKRP